MDIYDPIGKALGLPPLDFKPDLSSIITEKIPAWNKGINHFGSKENHFMFGKKHSEETKKKIAEAHKGMRASKETREKMSKSHMGKPGSCGMLGKKHSEETKQKMRNSAKGFSPETREKQRQSMIGKKLSEETKAKMREAALRRSKSKVTP